MGWMDGVLRRLFLYRGCLRTQQQVTLIDLSASTADCTPRSIWVHKCNLTASVTTGNQCTLYGRYCTRRHACMCRMYACTEAHTTASAVSLVFVVVSFSTNCTLNRFVSALFLDIFFFNPSCFYETLPGLDAFSDLQNRDKTRKRMFSVAGTESDSIHREWAEFSLRKSLSLKKKYQHS